MPYAITRSLNAGTGDRVLSGSTWQQGEPLTEVVLRVLRTRKGTYLPDPEFGLDYSVIDKATPNAEKTLELAIKAALAFLTRAGLLTKLSVRTERSGTFLLYDLSFVDPRTGKRNATPVTGRI